jgi:hypothetical protein
MVEKFDFNDILIVPAVQSEINSRKEVNPFYDLNGGKKLPLITAPMDTVVSAQNKHIFDQLNIKVCLPRGEYAENAFVSYSLDEFEELVASNRIDRFGWYLIDIANGHMKRMCDAIEFAKQKYPEITLMVGNVANPRTYMMLSNAGADYVRAGIGNGGGCFLEGSPVTTNNGYKEIQDIEIGDSVLTHTGEYKKVISTMQYPTSETLIKINDTVSTLNHEYYVLNKKYENIVNDDNIHKYAEWIEAKDLSEEYFLLEIL